MKQATIGHLVHLRSLIKVANITNWVCSHNDQERVLVPWIKKDLAVVLAS